jgi:predicted permease
MPMFCIITVNNDIPNQIKAVFFTVNAVKWYLFPAHVLYFLTVCKYWLQQNPEKICEVYHEATGENVLHFMAK